MFVFKTRSLSMIAQLIKLTFRNFIRNKFYSFTLVAGFSIAITICYLITGLLIHESSVDDFHKNKERIYRVMMKDPITYATGYTTYHELFEKLQRDFPEVELVTHPMYAGWLYVRSGEDKFLEKRILYADEAFLKIFDYKIISGDRNSSLRLPKSVILSQSTAARYFGAGEAIGQTIYLQEQPYTVTAVVEDASASHLQFDFLVSATHLPVRQNPLEGAGFTYIRLRNSSDATGLTDKLNAKLERVLSWKYAVPQTSVFDLQSLEECYFSDVQQAESDILIRQDRKLLKGAGLAMFIIIFIVAFNFINFSQAKALFRSKEIVILSIFGTGPWVVLLQFILEAIMLCCLALLLSLLTILVVLPFFNSAAGLTLGIESLLSPALLVMVTGITILISVVLGAIVYSLFARANTGKLTSSTITLRPAHIKILNGLIVIQIVVSTTLMLLSTAIWKQMNFISSQTLGSSQEGTVEVNLLDLPQKVNPTTIKTEFLKNSNVITASICMGIPLEGRASHGLESEGKQVELNWMIGDLDYIRTIGYEIIKGRGFQSPADTNYVILNETAMKFYQMSDDFQSEDPNAPKNAIGVVKDFHFESLHESIDPVVISMIMPKKVDIFGAGKLLVTTHGDPKKMVETIRKQWKDLFPDIPFDYSLLKDKYQAVYKKEQGYASLIMVGSTTSVLITLFGIVGLSVYTTYRRSKEIAIRKVHGASSKTILIMFVKQVTTWAMISSIIAVPLAMYLTTEWISSFAYRTSLSWQHYLQVVTGAIAVIILSILYQATVSSNKNPARVLRSE